MKKRSLFIVALLGLLLVPFLMFAQDVLPDPVNGPWDFLGRFSFLIGTFPGAVVLMTFAVPFVLGGLNLQGKFLKYLFTVLTVAAISLAGWQLSFGFLYGMYWYGALIGFAMLMLVQIGIFTWQVAKEFQEKLYDKFNPWKPSSLT